MIDWSVGRNSLSRRHRAGVSGNITSGFAARICQRFLHDRDEPPEPLQRQAGALGSMMRANQNTIAGNGHPLDRTGMKAGMQAGFYRALRRMACGRTVSTSRFTTFFSRTMKRFNPSLIALAVAAALAGCSQLPQAAHTSRATAGVKEMAEAPLIIGTYNPGEEAIFAVSSTLVQGKKEAVLIDAQFSAADARKVVEMIRKSGKKLTTIYISHSDPDYYFGPFREAVGSTLKGDRRTYQQDPANRREGLFEALLDAAEGADMLMVKPAGPYLDVLADVAAASDIPIAAYQVSGEYAMVEAAAANGWIDRTRVIDESLTGIFRAGADSVLTYWALEVARRTR